MLTNFIFKRAPRLFNGSLMQLQLKKFSDINKNLNINQQTTLKHSDEIFEQNRKRLEQNEKELKGINDYEQALSYYQQGKYSLSDEFFRRVLKILENGGQKDSEHYIHTLKK